jgi:wobble nucleotide-excising tRNase
MIEWIESIRDFGILRDFSWDSNLPSFGKLNLIYGWNYSGKTTLSRIFQAIEQRKLPDDYNQGSFTIKLADGGRPSSSNLQAGPAVRVFNRDYVSANFRTEYSAPAVFILGQENAASRAQIEKLSRRLARVKTIATSYSSQHQAILEEINSTATDKARDVRHLLGDPNFDRTRLNQRIAEIKTDPAAYTLSEDVVQSRIWTLRSGDQYGSLATISEGLPEMATAVEGVNELLQQTASNLAIERLRQNPRIESWVREGMGLHKDAAVCEFCGGPLGDKRLRVLLGHFSDEHEKLVGTLNDAIQNLRGYEFLPRIHDEMRILPELRSKFAAAKEALTEWAGWATDLRDGLVRSLRLKQTSIESKQTWSGDKSRVGKGRENLAELNRIIKEHNQVVSELEKARSGTKTSLEQHYAAVHFKDSDLTRKKATIKQLGKRTEQSSTIQERIASQIRSIEEETQKSSIGAARLNELVKYLLADSDLEVESIGDSEFQFRRGGHVAANLSEGEKTALTFAYFLTSLEAEGESLSDTIVFVDDPVSSLDLNHIYALHALLVERLEPARQLFVSTHNAELFNLLKGRWLGKNGGNREDTRAYHIWRTVNDAGEAIAELFDLPVLLRKYKSEYEFVFCQLRDFSVSTTPSLHEAYTVPNLLRKFLEAYLGFRKPSVLSWSRKLYLLLDSPDACREVQQFADDASHLQSLGRSLQHPAFILNARRCVCLVLDALKDKDPGHYESLCEIASGVGS